MDEFKWPMNEILVIKNLWPQGLWDIRDDSALAEWIVSDSSPLVIPEELLESAKEFYRNNAFFKASLFFKGGWEQAEWFVKTCEDFRLFREGEQTTASIEEMFIRICPEKIGGDTWAWLEENGAMATKGAA
ncbi:MAG: hypothetical protein ACPG5T_10610 [Endozoicomonas sp.]